MPRSGVASDRNQVMDGEPMNADHRELAAVAARFRDGKASGEELSFAFVNATVFCVHADEPGFVAIGEPGTGFVPFYTSVEKLAAAEGASRWISAPAVDLMQAIPEGYGLVVDRGSDSEVVLPSSAFRREKSALKSA